MEGVDFGTLLAGGRHAGYVWWCYGFAAVVLTLLAVQSLLWRQRLKRDLGVLDAARGNPEESE